MWHRFVCQLCCALWFVKSVPLSVPFAFSHFELSIVCRLVCRSCCALWFVKFVTLSVPRMFSRILSGQFCVRKLILVFYSLLITCVDAFHYWSVFSFDGVFKHLGGYVFCFRNVASHNSVHPFSFALIVRVCVCVCVSVLVSVYLQRLHYYYYFIGFVAFWHFVIVSHFSYGFVVSTFAMTWMLHVCCYLRCFLSYVFCIYFGCMVTCILCCGGIVFSDFVFAVCVCINQCFSAWRGCVFSIVQHVFCFNCYCIVIVYFQDVFFLVCARRIFAIHNSRCTFLMSSRWLVCSAVAMRFSSWCIVQLCCFSQWRHSFILSLYLHMGCMFAGGARFAT